MKLKAYAEALPIYWCISFFVFWGAFRLIPQTQDILTVEWLCGSVVAIVVWILVLVCSGLNFILLYERIDHRDRLSRWINLAIPANVDKNILLPAVSNYIMAAFVAIPSFVVSRLSFDLRPALSTYVLLLICVYFSLACAYLHLCVLTKQAYSAVIILMPAFTIFSGLFSIDKIGVATTAIGFLSLVVTPGIVLVYSKVKKSGSLLVLSVVMFAGIYSCWNWGDQCEYINESEHCQHTVPSEQLHTRAAATSVSGLPIIYLNLGGGGSRAALFSALVLKQLWWLTVPLADLNDEQKAFMAGLPAELKAILISSKGTSRVAYPGRLILIGTRFTSSVSGGSLTSACWAAGTYAALKNVEDGTGATNNQAPAWIRRAIALDKFFSGEIPQTNEAWKKLQWVSDSQAESAYASLEHDKLLELTTRNYLASAITGVFDFNTNRIENMRKAFERAIVDSQAIPNSGAKRRTSNWKIEPITLGGLIDSEKEEVIPYSLFNITNGTDGTRVIATNLSTGWFALRDGGTSIVDAQHVDVIHRLANGWSPELATCVYMSSDFPYGFPVSRLKGNSTPASHGNRPDDIELLDGGVSDNTGLNTSHTIVRSISLLPDAAQAHTINALTPFMIFEVNTSELVTKKNGCPILYNITEPSNAREKAVQVSEQLRMADYLSDISIRVGRTISHEWSLESTKNIDSQRVVNRPPIGHYTKDGFFSWYTIRCGDMPEDHVYTSWYLNRQARIQVLKNLLHQRETFTAASKRYLSMCASRTTTMTTPKISLRTQPRRSVIAPIQK